jgi:hypothetical protein
VKESDAPEPSPGLTPADLALVGKTRQGLVLAAPGFLLVLVGVIPVAPSEVALAGILLAVRFAGWTLLAVALALCAPTPNGPLPSWLKTLYVFACAGGALRVVYHRFAFEPAWVALEQRYVQLLWIAFLVLPWILWRFCQHRGLAGRAITWLWCAMALFVVFAINWTARTSWALWLCPAIGVALFGNSLLTSRDLWDDAVHKLARAGARAALAGLRER